MKEQEIIKEFDFSHLENEFKWVGISNLNDIVQTSHGNPLPIKDTLVASRGEFVGYDSTQISVNLFRDRVGGRNLYYGRGPNQLYVSTDIEWVRDKSLPEMDAYNKLNISYIQEEYLEFQVPFSNSTLYYGVFKVMPGELVTFNSSNISEAKREKYWTLKFKDSVKFNPKDLLDLIIDAVKFRKKLLDEKFTSYLSGGIDSSTVTSLLKPKESFSGFYDHEFYSEIDYIKSLKRKYVPVKITEERFYQFMSQLPYLLPDPMCGLGVIPQLIVAMEAFRGGYHYAFTGEGGDEIFCGYNWNTAIFKLAQAARDLQRDKYMIRYEEMTRKILNEGLASLTSSFIAKGRDRKKQLEWILSVWDTNLCLEDNIMKINVEVGLPAILTVDERVGLYSGVINVSPLIDHHIVEYVASIDPQDRVKIPKYLLREAMHGYLPEKIRMRYDKQGFPIPVEYWSWPMLSNLISSFQKRGLIQLLQDKGYSLAMDRWNWGITNLELICRELENV